MTLTKRLVKGVKLSFREMDENWDHLLNAINQATQDLGALISEVRTIANSNATSITSLQNSGSATATLVSALQENLTQIGNTITGIQAQITDLLEDDATVAARLDTLNSDLDTLEQQVASDLASQVSSINTRINNINATIATVQQELGDLAAADIAINTSLSGLGTRLDAVELKNNAQDTSLSQQAGQISTLQTDLGNLITQINDTIATQVGGVISDIDLLKSDVSTLRTDVNELRVNKANKSTVDAMQIAKADVSYVDQKVSDGIATREEKDHLAGKVVDLPSRADNSIPVYDATSQTYIHKTAADLQGQTTQDLAQLQQDVLDLETNKADKPWVQDKIDHHAHLLTDITDYVPPDVNKAYVDNKLGYKVDTTAFNASIDALNTAINQRPTTTYVDTQLNLKSDKGHHHSMNEIDGLTMILPNRFTYTSTAFDLNSGQIIDFEVAVPHQRLYGISVEMTGLTGSDQKVKLEIYGDLLRTKKQYSAIFGDTLLIDSAQAWSVRNFDNEQKIYVRVSNDTLLNLTGMTFTIVVEPF